MIWGLITGSRAWPAQQYATIWEDCHSLDGLVLGDCETGTDLWARRFAEFYQRPHVICPADWNRYRGNAGPRRNAVMVSTVLAKALDFLVPARAFAYYVPWAKNVGTRNCHEKCIKANIPTLRRQAK